jgi:hypothetical protein
VMRTHARGARADRMVVRRRRNSSWGRKLDILCFWGGEIPLGSRREGCWHNDLNVLSSLWLLLVVCVRSAVKKGE